MSIYIYVYIYMYLYLYLYIYIYIYVCIFHIIYIPRIFHVRSHITPTSPASRSWAMSRYRCARQQASKTAKWQTKVLAPWNNQLLPAGGTPNYPNSWMVFVGENLLKYDGKPIGIHWSVTWWNGGFGKNGGGPLSSTEWGIVNFVDSDWWIWMNFYGSSLFHVWLMWLPTSYLQHHHSHEDKL